jgi:transcriptional regulator with XRE-family HTH domain
VVNRSDTQATLNRPARTPLRRAREEKNLTRRAVAGDAGITVRGLRALEDGEHRPRLDTALALAAALGCDVRELFPNP